MKAKVILCCNCKSVIATRIIRKSIVTDCLQYASLKQTIDFLGRMLSIIVSCDKCGVKNEMIKEESV